MSTCLVPPSARILRRKQEITIDIANILGSKNPDYYSSNSDMCCLVAWVGF